MDIHHMLDWEYGEDGDAKLRQMLADGVDANLEKPETREYPIHTAARRRRLKAVEILLEHGANIDAVNGGGKTAYAHAIRRGFDEIAEFLASKGANTFLNEPDQLAVLIVNGRYDEAKAFIGKYPEAVDTGNPDEDRLLADVAGREPTEPVQMLIDAGANLSAPALDDGTPLHQAAWFGQPQNARLLIDAGAPVDVFDSCHHANPLGWVVHGSRFSGDAEKRQNAYIELTRMLLEARSSLRYPGDESGKYYQRLLEEASPQVKAVLEDWR